MNLMFTPLLSIIVGTLTFLSGDMAFAWTQKMEMTWPLSENDSRARARELALEAMRTKASNAVGKIVESKETLSDGKLSEEIKTIGISMIKVEDVRDNLKITADGRASLVVSATVNVDESELVRRASVMRHDIDKTKAVRRLADENAELRQELLELRGKIGSSSDRSQSATAIKRENDILDKLQKNEQAVTSAFKAGTLLSLAQDDSNGWEKEKARIDSEIFGELLRSPVQAKLVGVEKTGDKYVAKVKVGWQPNMNSIYRSLQKTFHVDPPWTRTNGSSQAISITEWNYNSNVGLSKYATRSWEYLSQNLVWLEITIANEIKLYPILYQANRLEVSRDLCAFTRSSEYIKNVKAICIVSNSLNDEMVRGPFGDELNPLNIELTQAEAAVVETVKARIILKSLSETIFPEIRSSAKYLFWQQPLRRLH